MIFCTLFDSNYLDKGLVLYRSLARTAKEFTLYIYAFDDRAYDVLKTQDLGNAVILRERELEEAYPVLTKLKKERSSAEFAWTCTPVCIEHVLERYGEPNCTYLDADLCFYRDPAELFAELSPSEHILITPHRFPDTARGRRLCRRSGKYCVEFNYFDQDPESRKALAWWREQCFDWCYHLYEPERMGDQKYLMKFPEMFSGVHELRHPGGGVAPWNLASYVFTGRMDGLSPVLQDRRTGAEFPVVFYHFQSMRYISHDIVIVRSETHAKKTKDVLYRPYLTEIEQVRAMLRGRGITFDVRQSYAGNPLIRFAQKHILRYKCKSLSDIYDLRKLRGNG